MTRFTDKEKGRAVLREEMKALDEIFHELDGAELARRKRRWRILQNALFDYFVTQTGDRPEATAAEKWGIISARAEALSMPKVTDPKARAHAQVLLEVADDYRRQMNDEEAA